MNRYVYVLLILLLAGCAQSPNSCPSQPLANLSEAMAFASDDQAPFRFPLDELGWDVQPFPATFCTSGGTGSDRIYHAAEDYYLPPGTPVYAFADGKISFSGPMGGYGWLIIMDHPQANLYSLYGHLSPSRWRLEPAKVEKGDLIGYLGDADENGGSPENPLRPHLHFGLRAGQRSDYSGMGEWRWQAGWIKPCPRDLGWLRPSEIISSQVIPVGGFPEPAGEFVAKWGVELLMTGFYLLWGVGALVYAFRKNKPFVLIISGGLIGAAGWITFSKGAKMSYALYAMAVLLLAIGFYKFIRHSNGASRTQA